MKLNFTLLSLLIISCSLNTFAQTSWENFDDPALASYFFLNGGLNQDFANPSTGGINTSAVCGEYVRSGETFDVIVMDPTGIDAVEDVNPYVAGTKTMSMKVYSPAPGITVQITLENATLAQPANYPAGRHSEYTATTTTSGEWEELTFSFVAQPDVSMTGLEVNRLVILFAPNTNASQTYLWDDLMAPEFNNPCDGVAIDPSILEDFECQSNITYEFSNGDLVQGLDNPDMTGVNTSATCARFTKFPPPTNDGAFGGDFEGTFTTMDYTTVSIDLLADEALDFLVIFQNSSETNLFEQTFTTSPSGVWETFTADLSTISPSEEIDRIVLLLNPASATEDTVLLDNITLGNEDVEDPCEGVVEDLSIFDDFECQRHLSYDFSNGTLVQNFANPTMDGLNASETCGQFTKFLPPTNDGAFGGDFEGTFTVFDYNMIHVDLHSDEVLDFLVILQDVNDANVFEQTFTTAGQGVWESFNADLSTISPSAEIDKVVLLLNPASETEDQILFDNLRVDMMDSVSEIEATTEVRTFPMPFSNELEVVSTENMTQITVLDMVGKELISISDLNVKSTQLEVSALPAGNYMMVITTASGNTITKKIIK